MKILRSKLLSKFKNVEHGFVSNVHNLSIQKISSLTEFQEIKTIDQVHSNQIVHFKDSSQFSQEFEGDALVTSVKGFGVGINTADCVPILIYDYNNQVVASVHAGDR